MSLDNKGESSILYIIAIVFIILWAIGFLGFHQQGIIHVLLVIAVIAIILRVIKGGPVVK
jgi:hypothetical protein